MTTWRGWASSGRLAFAEPEDHAASILEIMASVIDGVFGLQTLAEQKAFYERHVSSWMGPFFKDVMAGKAAVFYAAVGDVGRAFVEIEDAALAMG